MEQTKLRNPGSGEGIDPKHQFVWRVYSKHDYESIDSIVLPDSNKMFGDLMFDSLIETAIESFVYENLVTLEICAFICFKSYPNLPALKNSEWTHWMEKFYENFAMTAMNSFFVHFFTFCEPTDFNFLNDLFRYLFTETFTLDHIIFILPPGFSNIKSYCNLVTLKRITRIYPVLYDEQYDTQSLLVCQRSLFFDKINIRRALPEDNDDLVEILDADCKELRQMYGDYYIAEIILQKDSTQKIIIAESDNQSVGMMCVNSHVNIDKLYDYFELDIYHGLRKHTDDEILLQVPNDSFEQVCVAPIPALSEISVLDNDIPKNLTIKDVEIDRQSNEDNYISPDDENNLNNLESDPLDIFKQFAFILSSSSDSSDGEQNVSSDSAWFQTNTNLEIAKANKSRKTALSSSNTIFDQIVINSAKRISDTQKVKQQELTQLLCKQRSKNFTSESNAFAIELHGIRSDFDKRLTYLLLEAVFEAFPDREYCLITMPPGSALTIGFEYFVKVYPRSFLQLEHDLYCVYKYSIYGKLTVRIASVNDLPEIRDFINHIKKSKAVLKTIEELIINYFYLKFVILVHSNYLLIGLAILEPCDQLYLFKTNFEVSSYVNMSPKNRIESNGFIKYFTLAPMFRKKLSVIVTEMFRLTGFKRFFYYVKDSNTLEPQTAILTLMYPIRPRRRIVYHLDKLGGHPTPDYVLEEPPLMALYTLGINSIHKRKQIVPLRIVVVGTSTTGLSFLETLIFEKPAQKFYFLNLVLVTPHNHFESMIAENEKLKLARPTNVYYGYKYLQRLSLRTWVSVVHGSLKYIDKNKKSIITNRDRIIRYDLLYLFTGLEFGFPKHIASIQTTPDNFVSLNSWDDVELLKIKASLIERKKIDPMLPQLNQNCTKSNKDLIVVYGRTIEAYCIINYFLQTQPYILSHLVLVLPPHDSKSEFVASAFNDPIVDLVIKKALENSKIQIYDGYRITKWEVDNHDFIQTVVFQSKFHIINLDIALLISCDKKSVGMETMKAYIDSGLVFDGRLIINKSFQTNDPNIFAAGPVTKYRRILYADAYRHEYYNSAEIGREVAMRLIAKLSPDMKLHFEMKDFNLVVHKFVSPVIVNCVLPTGLNYLHIAAPGPRVPHRAAVLIDNYGIDIMTGSPINDKKSSVFSNYPTLGCDKGSAHSFASKPSDDEDVNKPVHYFRCHLNEFNLVSTIVCLTESQIDVQNIINLYGKHEKLLNNLIACNESNLVRDLFDFFQNSFWIYAIAHDRFPCLELLNKAIFVDSMQNSEDNLISDFIDLFRNDYWNKLPDEKRMLIVASYLYANRKSVEKNVLKFLCDYKDELPMYILPEHVHELLNCITLDSESNDNEKWYIKSSEEEK